MNNMAWFNIPTHKITHSQPLCATTKFREKKSACLSAYTHRFSVESVMITHISQKWCQTQNRIKNYLQLVRNFITFVCLFRKREREREKASVIVECLLFCTVGNLVPFALSLSLCRVRTHIQCICQLSAEFWFATYTKNLSILRSYTLCFSSILRLFSGFIR